MSRKLLGDFPNHYMIQHEDGSSFPVAKKGLSDELHQKIKSLPSISKAQPLKLSDGTPDGPLTTDDAQNASVMPDKNSFADVQATPSIESSPAQLPVPISDFAQAKGVSPDDTTQTTAPSTPGIFSDIAKNFIPGGALPQSPAPASSIQPAVVQPALQDSSVKKASYDVPAATTDSGSTLPGGYGDAAKSIKSQENALGSFNKDMASANSENQAARKSLIDGEATINANHQKVMNDLQAKSAQLSDAFMNGKIDPNRYYNNMSTGNKVLSAVALALGGIGSGLTGKPNAALEVINNAIDRDMQSQKADLEKNKNAMQLNHEAMQGEVQDFSLKKASLISAAQAQIGLAAAKSQNAQAIYNAKIMGQGLENQKQALMNDYSEKKSIMDAVQAQPGNTAILGRAVTKFVPEKQQEQAFKELDRVGAANRARDTINTFFGSADQKNTVMNRLIHGGFEPADMKALEVNVMPVLKDLEGRINPQEIEALHGLYPQPGDSASKIQTKLKGLNDFISSKSQSALLSGYGLMPRGGTLYNDRGQKNFNEGAPK